LSHYPELFLKPHETAACWDFAERITARIAGGEKEGTRRLTVADRKAQGWYVGRAAEYAACLYLGLDPVNDLDWGDAVDHGFDFLYGGWRVDMKATDAVRGEFLIWPVTRVPMFWETPFDDLGFARVQGQIVTLLGFMTKEHFHDEREVVGSGDIMVPGTWRVHYTKLTHPIDYRSVCG
jgi:hypothetical protein